ncbi:MAG TPA: hypothetical protein VMD25_04805 [Acidobacteriaceae bacterium]|nr:hypothetical protein [Acidobacteriaceae bacterium]
MDSKAERDVRFLKLYCAFLTLALLGCAAWIGCLTMARRHLGQVDVQRINVREPNGKLDLVISNSELMPPAIVGGRTFPNGRRSPGLLFYNGKGDEDGGLAFTSQTAANGTYHADGQLMFDQYNQDQSVGLEYNDENGVRSSGLHVWDRGSTPLNLVMSRLDGLQGAARTAMIHQLKDAGELGTTRVFVGRMPDRSADVLLLDGKGRPRLTMSVDDSGAAQIRFLDDNGKMVYSLPPGRAPAQ